LRKVSESGDLSLHIDGASLELSLSGDRAFSAPTSHATRRMRAVAGERGDIERAMQLSLRWGERSRRVRNRTSGPCCFWHCSSGDVAELRRASRAGMVDTGFHGYRSAACGGEPPRDAGDDKSRTNDAADRRVL